MDEVKRAAIEVLQLVARDVVAQTAKATLIDLGAQPSLVTVTMVLWNSGIQLCVKSDIQTGPHRSYTRIFNITLSETQSFKE